jgi:hypothetical protein
LNPLTIYGSVEPRSNYSISSWIWLLHPVMQDLKTINGLQLEADEIIISEEVYHLFINCF